MLAFGKCIHSCTHLGSLNIPSRQKLLDDWFYEGDLGFIFAPRGIGKTWLGMGLSTALSAGTACGPWKAHGRYPVLYVDGKCRANPLRNAFGEWEAWRT
jgi:AAA domain